MSSSVKLNWSGPPTAITILDSPEVAIQNIIERITSNHDEKTPNLRIAVLTMTGSCCPITRAHISCFQVARKMLLSNSESQYQFRYQEVLGFMFLNPDSHVESKMKQCGERGGEKSMILNYNERCELVRMSIKEEMMMERSQSQKLVNEPPWLYLCHGGRSKESSIPDIITNQVLSRSSKLPHIDTSASGSLSLNCCHRFSLNGADDVLKYQKWKECGFNKDARFIVIGRKGDTEKVKMQLDKIMSSSSSSGNGSILSGTAGVKQAILENRILIGPELNDISSTKVREGLHRWKKLVLVKDESESKIGDIDKMLKSMLHISVIDWMKNRIVGQHIDKSFLQVPSISSINNLFDENSSVIFHVSAFESQK